MNGLNLTETLSLAEKLQRAEERALAAETTLELVRRQLERETPGWVVRVEYLDLTAAREVMRKAEQRDELAAMVERKDKALDAIRTNRIGATGGCDRDDDCDCSEHIAINALSLAGPTALAELKARVRREVLEEAAKYYDSRQAAPSEEFESLFTCEEIAAELRRMAGGE